MENFRYIACVNRLTRQETFFIIIVASLLLIGLFVKFYRAKHLAPAKVEAKI